MRERYAIETEVVRSNDTNILQIDSQSKNFSITSIPSSNANTQSGRLALAAFHSPDQKRLSEKLAILEQGDCAAMTSSGMAAILNVILGTLPAGSHMLAQRCLYGATYGLFVNHLATLGIQIDFIDTNQPESWAAKLKPTTKLIYLESVSNPLLEIPDFTAIVEFARQHNLTTAIDNTFCSPINFNPLLLGFDFVIHSCSKYINGHNDIMAGCVVGSRIRMQSIIERVAYSGSSIDSHICFLLLRGTETLALRVRQQNHNAMALAHHLQAHPQIAKVIYPGLVDHPHHDNAQRFFNGYGGMLSFEIKASQEGTVYFLESLQIIEVAPSLGGVRSLINCPAQMTHAELPIEARRELGITDTLLRLSVGIEAVDDIIEDIEQALSNIKGVKMGKVHKFIGQPGDQYNWEEERTFHYGSRPDVSSGATVQWLLGAAEQVAEVALRYFEIPPGGYSAPEEHPYEHCVYVLRGKAEVLIGEEKYEVGPNDVVHTALNEFHQFINLSDTEPLGFLCAVTAHRSRKGGTRVYAESDIFPEYLPSE